MAVFKFYYPSLTLISRKIRMTEKFCFFHTVNLGLLSEYHSYVKSSLDTAWCYHNVDTYLNVLLVREDSLVSSVLDRASFFLSSLLSFAALKYDQGRWWWAILMPSQEHLWKQKRRSTFLLQKKIWWCCRQREISVANCKANKWQTYFNCCSTLGYKSNIMFWTKVHTETFIRSCN